MEPLTASSRPQSTCISPPPVIPPSQRLGSTTTTLAPSCAAAQAAITPLAFPTYTQTSKASLASAAGKRAAHTPAPSAAVWRRKSRR